MENLIARRHSQNDFGTVSGVRSIDTGKFICFFLEPAAPVVPAGTYHCLRSDHPIHGKCFELQSVLGHTAILIHAGNFASDTEGCLLPGLQIGDAWSEKKKALTFGVLNSKAAYAKLMEIEADTNLLDLTITDEYA